MATERDIEALRASLEEELAQLDRDTRRAASDRAPVALDQQSVGRLSRMDAMQRQAMAAAEEHRRAGRRERITSALRRIEGGEFGWCEECGDAIAPARLKLDPTVRTCIGCARG